MVHGEGSPRDDATQIRGILAAIHGAWPRGQLDEIDRFFHDRMVFVRPGFAILGHGREACLRSYGELHEGARVVRFETFAPTVDVWNQTAVAFFGFELAFEIDGAVHHRLGRELFVFERSEGRWRVVWRTVVFAS